MITEEHEGPVKIPFRWSRPEFEAVDGFGDMGSLSVLDGLVLAFGYIDDEGISCCGSGVMVAPGLIVTATHVAEATRGTFGMISSFVSDGKMRLWAPRQLHVLCGEQPSPLFNVPKQYNYSDVTLISCSLMSDPIEAHPLVMAHVEAWWPPKIGERLWAVGYRQLSNDGAPGITMLCTSGLVTDYFPEGRGAHLPGPCIEVAMHTVGGMSGGPVFNSEGHVIGIVSSSYETEDFRGPTYVSLILPAVTGTVESAWPKSFWPQKYVGLSLAKDLGLAKVHGEAIFVKEGVPINRDDFYEKYGNDFDSFLESETLAFIEALPNRGLRHLMQEAGYPTEAIRNIVELSVSLTEGVEDPHIIHCYTPDHNNVDLYYSYNLRIVDLDFSIPIDAFNANEEMINSAYENIYLDDNVANFSCYIRIYLSVSFTHEIQSDTQSDFNVYKIKFK